MNEPETIKKIFKMKTIAVVGLSPNPNRPSHGVASYLQSVGYKIIPVNPGHNEILGEKSYPTLKDISDPVEIVDVFRRPEYVDQIVDDTIKIGAKALWLQDGVVNEVAAKRAEDAGLHVVTDDCMLRKHREFSEKGYTPFCPL
ncbi:MAG: CoA-binding protein [Candidatus Marinimicrobia bacterium]|nr:CoA-binding protein [Candidatus Neomarinimicrobiota bacterium]